MPFNAALQVLICDLDDTLIQTVSVERFQADAQLQQRAFPLHTPDPQWQAMICDPRAALLDMFIALRWRYTIFYLTAGDQRYGESVVTGMRDFLLSDRKLSTDDQKWIREAIDPG